MAFTSPEDQLAFAELFGLPQQQQVPEPDYTGMGGQVQMPDYQPEPEPELPSVVLPDQLGPDTIDGLPYGSRVENLPTTITEAGAQPALTIDEQMAQAQPGQAQEEANQIRKVKSGGEYNRSSISSSNPVIVEKSRGNFKAPDETDINNAAAPEQFQTLEAARRQADAVNNEGEAVIAYNNAVAEDQRKVAIQDAKDADEDRRLDAIANDEADARVEGISNAMEAVKSMKVDPSRIWTKNGEANRVTGIAAAFIGGFLQPVLGSNTIQQTLNSAIERDIDAQKSNIDGARKNIGDLRQLHQLGLNQAETEDEQRDQDRLLRRSSLIGMLQSETMKLQDPVLRGKMEKEVAGLNAVNVKEMQAIRDKHAGRLQASYKFEMQEKRARQQIATQRRGQTLAHKRGMAELEFRKGQAKAKAAADNADAAGDMIQNPLNADIDIGRFINPKDATGNRNFQTRLASRALMTERMRGLIKSMKEQSAIYGGYGRKFIQSEDAQKLFGEYEDLRATYIKSMSGAQASDQEVKRLEQALPPPKTFITRDPTATVEAFLKRQADDMFIDANVNIKKNKWDPRKEWSVPTSVDTQEYDPDHWLGQMQSAQTPAEKLAAASQMYETVSKQRGKETLIHPGDPRFVEAANMLGGMSEEERRGVSGTHRIEGGKVVKGGEDDTFRDIQWIAEFGSGDMADRSYQNYIDATNKWSSGGRHGPQPKREDY